MAVPWFALEVVYLEEDKLQKPISIPKNNNLMEKIFNFEDRLVRFAGECIFFTRQLERLFENEYYKNQLIRSSGSACLNFGEAQGTITNKDFIFKVSLVAKELKESRNSLKILNYIKEGDSDKRNKLLIEVEQLIAISSKMIINKNNQ